MTSRPGWGSSRGWSRGCVGRVQMVIAIGVRYPRLVELNPHAITAAAAAVTAAVTAAVRPPSGGRAAPEVLAEQVDRGGADLVGEIDRRQSERVLCERRGLQVRRKGDGWVVQGTWQWVGEPCDVAVGERAV